MPMDFVKLIGVKCVERRARETPLRITSKQTIWKELSSLATSATKHSGPEILSGHIRDNTKTI